MSNGASPNQAVAATSTILRNKVLCGHPHNHLGAMRTSSSKPLGALLAPFPKNFQEQWVPPSAQTQSAVWTTLQTWESTGSCPWHHVQCELYAKPPGLRRTTPKCLRCTVTMCSEDFYLCDNKEQVSGFLDAAGAK